MTDDGIKRGLRKMRKRAADERLRDEARRCAHCGAGFYASHAEQRFCSRSCVGRSRGRKP